jgi:hypothetical protein
MADNTYLKSSYDRILIDHVQINHTLYRPRDPDMQKRMEAAGGQHQEMIVEIQKVYIKAVVELILAH